MKTNRPLHISCSLCLLLLFFSTTASATETYQFERLWPVLKQPWYFKNPAGITVSPDGNVYVADRDNKRIQKFTADGTFITNWGSNEGGDGQLQLPEGVAADASGYVYVADDDNGRIKKYTADGVFVDYIPSDPDAPTTTTKSVAVDGYGNIFAADISMNRIQKFSTDGSFISSWGTFGAGNGQFNQPYGVAVDAAGNVYVTDKNNNRVQKFNSQGEWLDAWGTSGTGDGQFNGPKGIAVDASGNVYVADSSSQRIQKFSSSGTFLKKWGSYGFCGGCFYHPYGVAVDSTGHVYVSDQENQYYWQNDYAIRKFTSNGDFIAMWCSQGTANGMFYMPRYVDEAPNGKVYIVDASNARIQEFSSSGSFLRTMGSYGTGDGQFRSPESAVVDSAGNLYVADVGNRRIQKFDSDFDLVTQWGSQGSGDGKFDHFRGIDVYENGGDCYVFVADTNNNRVQKFTCNGDFETKWSGFTPYIADVAVDQNTGNVYVIEKDGNRVKKFTNNGTFLNEWGTFGSDAGEFNLPESIAVDAAGYVYVSDSENNRVQKFDSSGTFITTWGVSGSDTGEISSTRGVDVASDGSVYIVDTLNARIQKFMPIEMPPNPKAIIVAGGGSLPGNSLWDDTQMAAHFAYRALTYQGFTKDSIYLLSADQDIDLDNNGTLDDVDGDATNANLQSAIDTWADDSESLIIYLVDHGSTDAFLMSDGSPLAASSLDTWIDIYQAGPPSDRPVTVIYDACQSGSFMNNLAAEDRIVITSTDTDESAYFLTQGSISFSLFFWDAIFNGDTVGDAFDVASTAMLAATSNLQTPQLDDNGDGVYNGSDGTVADITQAGIGTVYSATAPTIASISGPQVISLTTTALLYASGVTDAEGVARVWAMIRPPNYQQGPASQAVTAQPIIELQPTATSGRYEVSYTQFTSAGIYNIAIYAKDSQGNTSLPQLTTVTVNNPIRRRVMIVAGGEQTDPLWPAIEEAGIHAYQSLKFQGYSDDDITYLSRTGTAGVDALAVRDNIKNYLKMYGSYGQTYDVAIYLVGGGDYGTYRVNGTETLTAWDLDTWLDELATKIPGQIVVVYDASRSGSFLSPLSGYTPGKRMVVCSTDADQPAHMLDEGALSFSRFFWTQVKMGSSLRDCFLSAKRSVDFLCSLTGLPSASPVLDDNTDGAYNGSAGRDGAVSAGFKFGSGIGLSGVDPLVGDTIADIVLEGTQTSAELWADDINSAASISRVWAVIVPPGYSITALNDPIFDLPQVEFSYDTGDGRYEGTYSGFTTAGLYQVAIYARDTDGRTSVPSLLTVLKQEGPDGYEDDNTQGEANVIATGISIYQEMYQSHTLHGSSDEDWVKFYGMPDDLAYHIEASSVGTDCDPILEVYADNGTRIAGPVNDSGSGQTEYLDWPCSSEGIYYIRVSDNDPATGAGSTYRLEVSLTGGQNNELVTGVVTDYYRHTPIQDATVKVQAGSPRAGLTDSTGMYQVVVEVGTYGADAQAAGYQTRHEENVVVRAYETTTQNFQLKLATDPADSDDDLIPDTQDNCRGVANGDQKDSDRDCPAKPYTADPACGDACDPVVQGCQSDANGDGKVNTTDLGIMKTEFFRTNCRSVPCQADANGDGKVNTTDLGIMKTEFFRTNCYQ